MDSVALEKWRERMFRLSPYLLVAGLVGIALGRYFGLFSNFGVGALIVTGLVQARITLMTMRDRSYQTKHPIVSFLPFMIGLWCVLGSQPNHLVDSLPWLQVVAITLGGGLCMGLGLLVGQSFLFCLFREPLWQFIHSPLPIDVPRVPFSSGESIDFSKPNHGARESQEMFPKFPVNY